MKTYKSLKLYKHLLFIYRHTPSVRHKRCSNGQRIQDWIRRKAYIVCNVMNGESVQEGLTCAVVCSQLCRFNSPSPHVSFYSGRGEAARAADGIYPGGNQAEDRAVQCGDKRPPQNDIGG